MKKKTKSEEKANELAADRKVTLCKKKGGIGVTAVWYKNASSNSWLWFAKNWTEALTKLKDMKTWKSKTGI